jgi:hypothetical protein
MKDRTQPFTFETADEKAQFHERAAIREFDGGLPRAAAERLALLEIIDERRRRADRSKRSTAA